ncbi:MAG: CoA-binding protein [Desulfobacteraceae bacterium]|nr:CoA-binding protein [Desulfobacteraceae bacterium]
MQRKDIYHNLNFLFNPDTVAVIGASENPGKLGYHVMKSLTQGGFKGHIVPVNPGSKEIMGIPASPSISAFQGPIDLAVIVLPAKLVPQIFEECDQKGVKAIVLITAGFKEIDDPAGGKQQAMLAEMACRAGIPVIGPNTFGIVNLHSDLNASFTPEFSQLEKGGVTLVSQSGGISHLLGFTAMRENVMISKIVGLGNRLNVDFAEILPYLMDDPDTKVIVLYLEGIDEPKRLMEAAEKNRGKKPVVAYKTGSAAQGNQASWSHTGSMAGTQEVYEGALRQSGILCVNSTEELLDLAHALSVCPLPQGPRIAILSAQAGPGMAACDVCEAEGLEVVSFTAETQAAINELLPPLALRTNPVDMGPAWYDSSAICGIVRAVMEDENVDGIMILMMFASANREALPGLSELLVKSKQEKPIITCLVSPPGIWDGQVLDLEKAGNIVNLPTPERAAKAMAYLWQCRNYRNSLGH